ncbi:MAG: hypothetical protein ACI97N_002580 [Cognaticolwellia sp.]
MNFSDQREERNHWKIYRFSIKSRCSRLKVIQQFLNNFSAISHQ